MPTGTQTLETLRARLDETDRALVSAFEQRMELSLAIAECKRAAGLAVRDPGREERVLQSRSAMLRDPRWEGAARELYQTLMRLSREAQRSCLEEHA